MIEPAAPLRDRVAERFRELYGRAPAFLVRAPGRVNLLGAHVDYNDGWVLPGAIDRAIWLAAGPGATPRLRAASLELGGAAPVPLDPVPGPPARSGRPATAWIEYAAGVAWALAESGLEPAPLDAVVGSELPVGAGVSSSAALEVAFLLAWRELGGLDLDRMGAALLGRRVENEYLGVQSGIMDQFASLHGRRDAVVLLDCRTLEWEVLALEGVAVLVADSGVRRRLVEGGLNDRRGECVRALEHLRRSWPELRALRDLSLERLEAARSLPQALGRRARHVIEECARVRRGAELLRAGGGAAAIGELMSASHRSSRELYEVSTPELDLLAEAAATAPGCHGARLMGAGFGGCVAALAEEAAAGSVADELAAAFGARFGVRPVVRTCRLGPAAAVA